MQNVAVGWQLYSLTGSALDLGLVGLVQFVPTIALTLVVGQVADRCDRRLVVVVCHATEAGTTAALALGSLGGWLGRDGILGMVAILGAARAFENPSRAALVPRLVPFALIPRAIASVTSAGQTARIVGPALGGVLYGLGPTAVYATVAALYLLAAAFVGLVHAVQPAHEPEEMTPASLFSGMTFILRERLLLGLLSLDLFAVLLGGATRHSLVQIRTPDSMRGRVSAAHSLTTGTSNQLGEFESGLLAALFGPVAAVLIGGIGTIVVVAVWMQRFPELRRFHLV